jgi:hypothetical protein
MHLAAVVISSLLRAVWRKPVALWVVLMIILGAYLHRDFYNVRSTSTAVNSKTKLQLDAVTLSGLKELNEDLRPKLASDPRFRGTVNVLDKVQNSAVSPPPAKTFWGKAMRLVRHPSDAPSSFR